MTADKTNDINIRTSASILFSSADLVDIGYHYQSCSLMSSVIFFSITALPYASKRHMICICFYYTGCDMSKILEKPMFWIVMAVLLTVFEKSPAVALCIGAAISLIWGNPIQKVTGGYSKKLLQLSVILLGFGLQLAVVLRVGLASIGLTLVSISLTMAVGFMLSSFFRVDRNLGILLSSGTAICGGSAIAAMSPAIGASHAQTAVAMAVVFLLNGLGLIIFPHIGTYLGMSQTDFGLWSALAIHDTSSVVGAAAIYGTQALAVATTVKLTRALWILPLSFAGAKLNRSESKAKFPYFLLGFLLAALIRSYVPELDTFWDGMAVTGKKIMVATLFLVGSGLTVTELKKIGTGALLMAVTLWIIVSCASLWAIRSGLIQLNLPI